MANIIKQFKIEGDVLSCEPYGNGHINRTYLVVTSKRRYILQQINTVAFKNVDELMANIEYVTSNLEKKGIESLKIIRTLKDELYHQEGDKYFRLYDFVENSVTLEEVTDTETLIKDAVAYGKFHKCLRDFDASKLYEVIPNFHNTPKRFRDLLASIAKDVKGRKSTCMPEIELALSYEKEIDKIMSGLQDGSIPLSITHNDPKINNALFDAKTDDARCIIDLDTIMPGSYLFDFGDALRSLFTGTNEDSRDLSKLKVNYELYKNYANAYLSEMRTVLSPRELELLPYSAFLLTYECGIRFLTDYLDGDVYFHTKFDEHNLVRCRTQLTLAKDIFDNLDKLHEMVK